VREIVVGLADSLDDRDLVGAVPLGEFRKAWVQFYGPVEIEWIVDRERGP